MKLIIDVDEKLVCEGFERNFTEEEKDRLIRTIGNGTPLPKGHGRLIDADNLPLNAIDDANYGSNYIKIAPTIIEADKEVGNDDSDNNH